MNFLPALAVLAAIPGGADPAEGAPAHREKIVVTAVASRVAEAVDATPATVTVIEREQLERALAGDIREALRYEPGVSVENGAARFGLGNIAIRGLDGNRVQMLLDGVRLPDHYKVGSFSNASRNPFDVALLSRIEVLRGPGSALYGSDALAGVVSFSTIDPADVVPKGAAHGGFAQAGYDSADRSTTLSAAAAGTAGDARVLLAATGARGHERDNRGGDASVGAARTAPNPQDARGGSLLAKLLLSTPDGGRWRATLERHERRVETDVLSLNPQSARTVSLDGDDRAERTRASVDRTHYALGPLDELSWVAYVQDSATRQDTAEVRARTTAQCLSAAGGVTCRREARFTFAQRQYGATAIARAASGRHEWVGGAEWSRTAMEEKRDGRQVNLDTGIAGNVVGTDVFPTRDFPLSRVERAGLFAQDTIAWGGAWLVPALRYDRFEMTPRVDDLYAAGNPTRVPAASADSAWSPKLGVLVPLGASTRLSFQAAAGFRAPPAFDVNVGLSNLPLGYTVIPNPDLRPETSRGIEAGVRGRAGALDYAVTAFRTDYDDLIVSRAPLPCPGDPRCAPGAPITFQSQNVTRARIEGVEARAEATLGHGFTARVGAAWTRGDDRSRGVPLNAVDPAKVVAGLAWDAPGRRGGAALHVTHARAKTRIDASAGVLFATPAYTTVDATAFARLGARTTLRAGAFNLLDRKYWLWSDVRGVPNPGAGIDRYTQPGRNFAARIEVAF